MTNGMTMPQALVIISFILGFAAVISSAFHGAAASGSRNIRVTHVEGKPEKSLAEQWAVIKPFFARKRRMMDPGPPNA